MFVFGNDWPLRAWRPGLNVSFGALRYRKKNRFTDWEFHVGGMHMESIPLPAYECSDPRVFHAGPIPCRFVGFYTYKYHFTNLAYQYKIGQLKKRKRSDFFWSAGGSVQMNFIRSYSPLRIPKGFYAYGSEVNKYGNILWWRLSNPALAAVFETGIVLHGKKNRKGIRFSVFGEAQFTPSTWDIPGKPDVKAFPLMAGFRMGFLSGKKTESSWPDSVLPANRSKKQFLVYTEAGGLGIVLSANLECKLIESPGHLIALYGRAGVSHIADETPGAFAGLHLAIGSYKKQLDVGAGFLQFDLEKAMVLTLGTRFVGKKGLFVRPALTPVLYSKSSFFLWGGVSLGYTWSVKKKKAT